MKILLRYLQLCKPRIIILCIIMTFGGLLLAPNTLPWLSCIMLLLGTACSVAAANTFNMIYERHSDALMHRTCQRPIVIGKIKVLPAFIFACILMCLSLILLSYYVNALTTILAFLGIIFYVILYTPLKKKTPLALVIGAIPGAIPPLLGWSAAVNAITLPGCALFSVLFFWQMPHFIAISLCYQEDYARANIKTVTFVRGEYIAKIQALIWTMLLLISSLSIIYFKLAAFFYGIIAIITGFWFLYLNILGIVKATPSWPRKFFLASLFYLPLLVLGIVLDKCF